MLPEDTKKKKPDTYEPLGEKVDYRKYFRGRGGPLLS